VLRHWYDGLVTTLVVVAVSVMLGAALIGTVSRYLTFLPVISWGVGRIGLTEASRAIWPFVLALVLVNAVLIVFPPLTTIIPRLFLRLTARGDGRPGPVARQPRRPPALHGLWRLAPVPLPKRATRRSTTAGWPKTALRMRPPSSAGKSRTTA
jgi:hypothetical protein